MFLSLAARILINVEALNMVESVGNVTRHRRATIVVHEGKSYKKIEVPAISGESIAHAYQEAIVEAAKNIFGETAPVCEWCERGEFFKSMDDKHTVEAAKGIKDPHMFEKTVIENCIVEDIGGFLRAERPPVKRTSRFYVGYMLPVMDAIKATAMDTQSHARHAPCEAVKGEQEKVAAQMIYYVETGSALYGLSSCLDIDGIGRTSMIKIENAVPDTERIDRVKVALTALTMLLSNVSFGAKRTRFLPFTDVKSLLVAVSKPLPFVVSPPSSIGYLQHTLQRKNALEGALKNLGVNEQIALYAYSSETEIPEGIKKFDSVEDLLKKVADDILASMR